MIETIHYFLDSFNSRELATLTWIGLVIILLMFKTKSRNGFGSILQLLFSKKLFTLFIIQICFFTAILILANFLGIWEKFLIKDSVWFIGGSFALTIQHVNSKNVENSFISIIKSVITLTVIIEFIGNFYTFHYLIELVLIPILVILGGMSAFTEKDRDKSVNNLVGFLLGVLGLWFLIHSLVLIYYSFGEFYSLKTIKLFLQPIILSVFYLPFLYMLLLSVAYENLIAKMRSYTSNSNHELKLIKKVLRTECGLNLNRIKEISSNHKVYRAKSSEELKSVLQSNTE